MTDHLAVQPLFVIGQRHLVNVAHIHAEDHRRRPDVAEQRDLSTLLIGKWMLGPA